MADGTGGGTIRPTGAETGATSRRLPDPAETAPRYATFISYRHAPADRRWAVWLYRSLETYRLPKHLQREGCRLGWLFDYHGHGE